MNTENIEDFDFLDNLNEDLDEMDSFEDIVED